MALSTPTGYSANDLVFQEDFSGTTLNSTWHNYITSNAAKGAPWNSNGSGGNGPGGQYDADYNMPSQVTVNNGTLNLTAIQAPVRGNNQGTAQTFPITSGAVSSYGNFEFTGGYLQISMKAPAGDGAWPGLWLMPGKGAGNSGDNFEIDMQEGGYTGSGPANQAFSAHLHTPNGKFDKVVNTGVDLTADFHTYAIDWVPGKSITWYLDGKQMAQVTSAQMPIPNQPMELIMDNQVANSNTAGWHTVLGSSTPSSMQMQVDSIQLYQPTGSGYTVTGANVSPSASISPPVTTPPVTSPPVVTTPVTPPADTQQVTTAPGSGSGVVQTDPPPVTSSGSGAGSTTTTLPTIGSAYGQVSTGGNNPSTPSQSGSSGPTSYSMYGGWGGWGSSSSTLAGGGTTQGSVTGSTSPTQATTGTYFSGTYGGGSSHNANQSFSLLSQYLAGGGSYGQANNGQITTASPKPPTLLSGAYFTRPQY